MEQNQIVTKLTERFKDAILEHYEFRGQHAVSIAPGDLVAVAEFLRDDPELDFNMLIDIGGADYLGYDEDDDDREHRFEVAYQFYSVPKNHRIRVKVRVADESVSVPSLWERWGVANWMEREVWDMYGVRFTGHPNLRRILCHDDFEGHALRKDYPKQKRQQLARPTKHLLTDKPEWA
jgi:NADH-quinone oxidoreductase subunit C